MKPCVLVLTAVLIPGALHAQEAQPALKGLDRSALSTVFVLDDTGVETRGQLLRLDSEAIVVLVDGSERRFETHRVARVSRRGDSLRNGVITGLIVGIVDSVVFLAISQCGASCDERARVALAVINIGMYTAIGTAIDAAIKGRTVLYQAPPMRMTNQPRGGAAVSVRLTW